MPAEQGRQYQRVVAGPSQSEISNRKTRLARALVMTSLRFAELTSIPVKS